MKQQLKWTILTCFTLTFFGCEPLPHAEKVGAQQITSRETFNFNNNRQFQSLANRSPSTENPEGIFLSHSVRIESLVVNSQWQGTSINRKSSQVEKDPEE